MASYPILAATLPALDATKNDPQGTEDAAKLDDALRQTRNWCVDFLSLFIDSTTNKLKSTGFDASSLPNGGIRGSSANGGSQREILQGSVSDVDLRDGAVTTNKIADLNVSTGKVADLGITTGKIADLGVTTAKIAAQAVTDTKLANLSVATAAIQDGAVTTAKILDANVTTGKIADRNVTVGKMPAATNGQLLIGDSTSGGFRVITPSGAVAIDRDGVFSLVSSAAGGAGYVRIYEAPSSEVASLASVWTQYRGDSAAPWAKEETVPGFVSLAGKIIRILVNSTWLIRVYAPAYSVGRHQCRIAIRTQGAASPSYYEYGTAEVAEVGNQTSSILERVVSFTNVAAGDNEFTVDHWTERVKATNGLGVISGATGTSNQLAQVCMIRVS